MDHPAMYVSFIPSCAPHQYPYPLPQVIIMAMIQIIAFPLGTIRQPRVISEVIAGIVLGPTGSFPSTLFFNSLTSLY